MHEDWLAGQPQILRRKGPCLLLRDSAACDAALAAPAAARRRRRCGAGDAALPRRGSPRIAAEAPAAAAAPMRRRAARSRTLPAIGFGRVVAECRPAPERADEEHRGADRRRARQEVGAAGGAEQAARGAAAERRRPCRRPCRAGAAPGRSWRAPPASARPARGSDSMFIRFDSDWCVPQRFSGGAADGDEIAGLQRRAADQAAVDVGLREQRRRVVGLDAAAVEDAASRPRARWPRASCARSSACTCLRLLGRRGACRCRSPRPARRRRRSRSMQCAERVDHRGQLARDDLLRCARLRARPSVSPTQTIGVRPCASAALALSATSASLSPCSCAALGVADDRRSGSRTRPASPPRPRRCRRPTSWREQSCAPQRDRRCPPAAPATCAEVRRRHADRDVAASAADAPASSAAAAPRWRRGCRSSSSCRRPAWFGARGLTTCSTSLPMCWFDLHQRMRAAPLPRPGRPGGSPA